MEEKEIVEVPKKIKKASKKVTRTFIKSLIFVSVMFGIEVFFPRYSSFNTLRYTSFNQLPWIGEIIDQNIPFIAEISFFYTTVLILTLLMFFAPSKAKKIVESNKSDKKKLKKLKKLHSRWDYVQFAALIGMMYVITNSFFFSIANVSGASMESRFFDEDDVLISHNTSNLQIGDVIVLEFFENNMESSFFIKRVIGTPGDTVLIESGHVYVNGVLLEEPYLEPGTETPCTQICEITLEDNEYYVLGDNRSNSRDSRQIGPVLIDDIYGEVIYIIRPFSRMGTVSE
jgi:signal peptidase I